MFAHTNTYLIIIFYFFPAHTNHNLAKANNEINFSYFYGGKPTMCVRALQTHLVIYLHGVRCTRPIDPGSPHTCSAIFCNFLHFICIFCWRDCLRLRTIYRIEPVDGRRTAYNIESSSPAAKIPNELLQSVFRATRPRTSLFNDIECGPKVLRYKM